LGGGSPENRLLLGLSVVVIERLQPGDEAETTPVDLVRSGVGTNIVWLTGAVGEEGHRLLPGPQEVGDPRARRAGDHVSGPELVGLALHSPGRPGRGAAAR